MDIIVGYCEAWDSPLRTSKHHFVERLAKAGHRVLYLEVPMSILSALKHRHEFFGKVLPKIKRGLTEVKENIWTLTGFFPLPYHSGILDYEWVNYLNQKFFLRSLNKALKQLNFQDIHFIYYYPLIFPLIKELPVQRVLLHMVDEWQGLPGIPNSMRTLTKKALSSADLVVVTSQKLYDTYKPQCKHIELLRHGTDARLFQPISEGKVLADERLEKLQRPIIGYYGALQKLDLNIVMEVATKRPDWTFVLVGPVGGSQGVGSGAQLKLSNIHYWPPVAREKLPAFIAGLDAFWAPYEINELHENMCSIKFFEVLSSGIPIVTSKMKEAEIILGEYAGFAISADEHITELSKALHRERRIVAMQEVQSYSWDARFEQFEKWLAGLWSLTLWLH